MINKLETSQFNALHFVKSAYKTLAISGVVGLACAILFMEITPKRYEATAKILIMQFLEAGNTGAANIESPALLIARLSQPTGFTPEVIDVCKGGDGSINSGVDLLKSLKLTTLQGVLNGVELKIFAASPHAAELCAWSIFEMIKKSHTEAAVPIIERAKHKLADSEGRLESAKIFIAKADNSGGGINGAYLSVRDEIHFLLEDIYVLRNLIAENQNRSTLLLAPIYVSNEPVAPKKRVVLLGGLLGGLLLGLLLILARQMGVVSPSNDSSKGW